MFKKIYFLLICLSIASISNADTVTLNPDHPEKYVVQKGDTLWDISARFLQKPWHWPMIWKGNPQIADPHLIYPGNVISLSTINGELVLVVDSADTDTSDVIVDDDIVVKRDLKLSPEIRSYKSADVIPSIPVNAIQQFLTRSRIVSKNEMNNWPYIISSHDGHLASSANDRIYVQDLPKDSKGTRYAVYRRGSAYTNPRKDKNRVLGYEALYLGDAVVEKEGDPATAIVTLSKQEILIGDKLAIAPVEEARGEYIPSTPTQNIDANIISVVNGVAQTGQYQVVVVDVGGGDGIEVGSVLGIYQGGRTIKDETKKSELVTLPEEYTGVLMVFRVFKNVSYALVMEAVSPIHVLDSVKNL